MYGFFLFCLCLSNTYIRADLFDLYKISNLYRNLPEHIQQKIIDYVDKPSCYICLGTICKSNERIINVAYNDYTTISILKCNVTPERDKHKLRTYKLHPFETCYRLSQFKPSIRCRFMPIIPKYKFESIKERFPEAQPIVALPKSFIEALVPAQKHKKIFIEGLFLSQHNKAQWYIYECGGRCDTGDYIDNEIAWVPLNNATHFSYGATTVGTNVFIYKHIDSSALQYLCCLPHPTHVSAAAFSPDNTHILTACIDNTLRIWSLPIIQIKTIEQLLLIKLITTAQHFETFWSLENLAQRLHVPLSKNLSEHTTSCVTDYLTKILSQLDEKSQKILINKHLTLTNQTAKKQHYCSLQ